MWLARKLGERRGEDSHPIDDDLFISPQFRWGRTIGHNRWRNTFDSRTTPLFLPIHLCPGKRKNKIKREIFLNIYLCVCVCVYQTLSPYSCAKYREVCHLRRRRNGRSMMTSRRLLRCSLLPYISSLLPHPPPTLLLLPSLLLINIPARSGCCGYIPTAAEPSQSAGYP